MLLFVLAVLFVDEAKVELDKAELKKFAGTWAVLESEHGGKKAPRKEIAPISIEIDGTKMTTRDGTYVKEESSIAALDTKAKPAALDLKITAGDDKGKVIKAIYKVDDDKITICFAEPGKDRPKEFAGKEGTGHTMLLLLKQKK